MIKIIDLCYARIGAVDLNEAVMFATKKLGLQEVRREENRAYVRGDDRDHDICYVEGGIEKHVLGFEIENKDELKGTHADREDGDIDNDGDEDNADKFLHKKRKAISKSMKKNKKQFGILICGSGAGMSMTANKHKNIRAALCYNIKSTKLSRSHNDANVMTIGSRLIKKRVALKCVDTFLKTNFDGGRHFRRVKKI